MAENTQVPPTRIEIRADPIVVERPTSPPSRIPCTLNLFFDSETKTAFLKLRLSITTYQQEDQSVYLLVGPEQIISVTFEDDEATQDPEISQLCNSSFGTIRLRIELSKAGSVVGPRTWPVPPLTTTSIIEDFSSAIGDNRKDGDENDISTQSGSPPPYDDAAAGPSTAGPARPSPGPPEQHHSHKPSMKRRRPSSSPELGPELANNPLRFFEDICNKIWQERQARLENKIFAELGRTEARIVQSVKEQISPLQDELTNHIEQADGNTATLVGDLLDEAFDERITNIKVELEDYISDELGNVETSIWDQLEAGTWETNFVRRREHH
ncbi:hypothetical protein DHEL01_v212837 [Diaporthe helianthi]|uniref:Uncharacterized protein n=1 Tax=Diaporthe helianthi TaxID=158607 RepID=A0A2P5HEW2_DIAHE|nr:hypothetical protein DHEL01_v212837 [Diaporthe helianthi]